MTSEQAIDKTNTCTKKKGLFLVKTKKWLVGMLVVGALFQTAGLNSVSAETLEEINAQEEVKQSELSKLQTEVAQALKEVNGINDHLNELEQEIKETEETIAKTETDITEQKQLVSERVEQAKGRLQTIQTTEMNQNVVLSILESENISDLLHRAYVLVTLQSAGNEQIEAAQVEYDKLVELQELLTEEKAQLDQKNEEAVAQKEEMDKKVASLQQLIEENRTELAQLAEKRQAEEERIAEQKRLAEEKRIAEEERAAQEKARAAMAAAKQETQTVSVMKTSNAQKSETKPVSKEQPKQEPAKKAEPKKQETKKQEAPKEETSSSSSTKTLTVSATGYSTAQPGLSTHTAMGIDLRTNPMVIAVDPSVIPLGTMVEVPGYGVAIAGDTGGAIKGNKIDIHFTSVSQAISWGRRTITIKILN